MTTNQIQYLRNLEDKRHNLATEAQGVTSLGIQQQQADTQKSQAHSSYIIALANSKQAEAAMNQANARWGELQYKYDTIPLYEREVSAKEVTAQASATGADASVMNAETNRGSLGVRRQQLDIDWERVKQLSAEISTKFAHNELDRQRLQADINKYMQEYALAKDDLERKKVNDRWDVVFRAFEGIGHTGERIIKAINDAYRLRLDAFKTLRAVVGTEDKSSQSKTGFGGRRK